jgi:hypothetical protein
MSFRRLIDCLLADHDLEASGEVSRYGERRNADIKGGEISTTKKPAELASGGLCQQLMQRPYFLATQSLTNFRLARNPSFWSFACFLHSSVFCFRAALSAADIFAASAGVGMNAVPPTSAVAIMLANSAVTTRDMMRSPWIISGRRFTIIHHS